DREAETVTQCTPGGVPAVHPVHTGCRGRGGGAQVDAGDAECVGVPPSGRSAEHPAHGDLPTGDVTPGEVRVVLTHTGGRHRRAADDDVAEAGCEALDLAGDCLRHVDVAAEGHVGVGPQRPQPVALARRVGDGRVGEQHTGSFGKAAAGDVLLRRGDLLPGATDV